MNKSELVERVAKKTGISAKDTAAVIGAFCDTVTEALTEKESVTLIGFGTFETRERAAREGINPQTKAKISIAASTVPAFKPGKSLKDKVNH